MKALVRMTGLALALGLGAALALDGPAEARTLCDPDGTCIGATSFNIHKKGWRLKTEARQPRRYACDSDGWNCRYTRAYYLSDDGNARWDPSLERDQPE